MFKLYEYQERSVQHLLDVLRSNRAGVDGSDTGTGKTPVAVEVMRRLNLPTLAVAPKAVLPGWHRTAASLGTELDAVNYERLRMGNTPYGSWTERGFRWNPAIKLLFFDESHRCKGRDTKNSEMLRAARRQDIPTLLLSATLADTPLELDAVGYALRLHDGNTPPTLRNPFPVSFGSWASQYGCGGMPFEFKGGPGDMARINALLYPAKGVRVRIQDLGDAFPETQILPELYDVEDPARLSAIYADLGDAWKKLNDRIAQYNCLDSLVWMGAERQQAELLKVPVFVELAKDAVAQGLSVCIFVNYRMTLDEILSRLGSDCRIDGSQVGDKGAAQREANRLAFQGDRERVIGCISEAGGVGLDLHDVTGKHPRLSLISPGFNAKLLKQVFGRVRRAGAKSKSIQRIILAAGTIEDLVYQNFVRKSNNLDALNDGDLFPVS